MSQPDAPRETPLSVPMPLTEAGDTRSTSGIVWTSAEAEITALRAEVARLTGQLAHWQTCSNCGKKMSAPGICDDAVTEREKGLELMQDETLTRAEKTEAEVATLRERHEDMSRLYRLAEENQLRWMRLHTQSEARLAAQAEALETLEQVEGIRTLAVRLRLSATGFGVRSWAQEDVTLSLEAAATIERVEQVIAALRTTP